MGPPAEFWVTLDWAVRMAVVVLIGGFLLDALDLVTAVWHNTRESHNEDRGK